MREITVELISSKTDQETRDKNGVGDTKWTGTMILGPTVGQSFTFFHKNGARQWTSTVKNIRYITPKKIRIGTRNSVYYITLGRKFND